MIKKMCVVFLSLCIAAAMVLGVNHLDNHDAEAVSMCEMDAAEVSC